MTLDSGAIRLGALNLLQGCAGATAGESLLVLYEDPACGYYGHGLAEAIAGHARQLGLVVSLREVPFIESIDALTPRLEAEVRAADHTFFLARLGDQLRFQAMPAGTKPVVSYVLDREALASPFGSAPYSAFVEFKGLLDHLFFTAAEIHVTCPLGTDMRGRMKRDIDVAAAATDAEVTIKRYPVSVFSPLDAAGFKGRVAIAHLLVGTGSRYYEPYGIGLTSTLFAHIDRGRLKNWTGDPSEVARAEAHYAAVSEKFGIARDVVHSWHAGIHPGCSYAGAAEENYERWSGSAFGNPRLLHFHTCGDYAPGEICWNVVDPTIEVDGAPIWNKGRIEIDNIPGASAILARHPEVRRLFDRPSPHIGIGALA